MILNIISLTTFNQKLEPDDLNKFKYLATAYSHEMGGTHIVYEFIPYARFLMSDPLVKYRHNYNQCFNYTLDVLKAHKNTYDESVCRDFCDSFIGAQLKAEAECRPGVVQWLTDQNIVATVIDLIFAGTETTYATLQWMVLFVAYFEDWQRKMRTEIDDVLADRVVTLADRRRMHCVQAFIAETLRYRTAAPVGSP
ncbi:unnamed protein product, partial [Medioppia subpectinata]